MTRVTRRKPSAANIHVAFFQPEKTITKKELLKTRCKCTNWIHITHTTLFTDPFAAIAPIHRIKGPGSQQGEMGVVLLLFSRASKIRWCNTHQSPRSPTPCWARMVVCFAIIPYPISIHGQTNNLVDLIQQDLLRDIVLYTSHHLFLVSSLSTFF